MPIQLTLADPADTSRSGIDHPFWATGFRPFFLGGALLAALLIPIWLFLFTQGQTLGGALSPIDWHAHEMIFGFTTAIIAGFLLTAVPKWTGRPTASRWRLLVLALLWVAGRLAMGATLWIPYALVAAIDLLFLPLLALFLSLPIAASKTPRNLGFIPLLAGLAIANALFHLQGLGMLEHAAELGLNAGLGLIVVIMAIVGGRVIPFFTTNALGRPSIDRRRPIDLIAIATTVGWLFFFLIAPDHWSHALMAGLAGISNLGRMIAWNSIASRRIPLLWVLHIGYAFIGVGLLFFASFTALDWPSRSVAIHALTAGAIGILCLGMMARVSLGHTGRSLEAPKLIVAAFLLITLGALSRVFLPLLWSDAYTLALYASTICWMVAWLFFLIIYIPILITPRADGRPG